MEQPKACEGHHFQLRSLNLSDRTLIKTARGVERWQIRLYSSDALIDEEFVVKAPKRTQRPFPSNNLVVANAKLAERVNAV